jgi:hypothetical protein
MNSIVRRFVLLVLAVAIPAIGLAQEQPQKSYTDEELIEILRNDGYRAVELTEDRVISIKVDGLTYVLYVYEDDDLQMYFGVTGYVLTPGHMNEWNRTKRLSRAYLDHENDPFSAVEFRQFLIENDQSE